MGKKLPPWHLCSHAWASARSKLVGAREMSSVSLHHVELATNGTRQHAARACESVAPVTKSANECVHSMHCRRP